MRGVFTSEQNIRITLGKDADGVTLRFDRYGLEQLADLALELLAVPYGDEPPERPVRILKPGPSYVPDLTRGEDSAFIVGLRRAMDQLWPYAAQLEHPDHPDVKPYGFADEMLLSTLLRALGCGMRELAHSRRNQPARLDKTDGERKGGR